MNDRVLWSDGDSSFTEEQLVNQISTNGSVKGMFIDEMTSQIEQYNKYVDSDRRITVKTSIRDNDLSWNLPDEWANLSVDKYVVGKLMDHQPTKIHISRVRDELELYDRMGLTDVLRTLIYIINTLQTHNIVWGVGRGSSVASYVLFLIGVHNVDSVRYQLDIGDFLRPDDTGE